MDSTTKLKSYGAAKREILPGVEHRQSRYINNRCENSHRPPRQRERRMQGFKSPGHARRFLSAYGPIAQYWGESNKGTKSFTGLLYYLSYQYVRSLADFGFRRVSLNIWGTPLLGNSWSNMTFEKL
jgi:DDE domain